MKKILFFAILCTSLNLALAEAKLSRSKIKPEVFPTDTVISNNQTRVSTGGGSIGGFGGGDVTDKQKVSAWFYGNEEIEVCYQMLKSFGLSESTVEKQIRHSLKTWSDYFTKKKINQNQEVAINTNFSFKGKCKGDEDLVLFLGTGPIFQNLLDLKAYQTLNKPVAFANKTHLSKDLKWAKGYIRFVESFSYKVDNTYYPDWSKEKDFSLILTHELGHVLGFVHTSDTIMTSQIVKDIIIENETYSQQIDHKHVLYSCQDCEETYQRVTSEDSSLFGEKSEILLANNTILLKKNKETTTLEVSHKENLQMPQSLISNFVENNLPNNHSIFFITFQNRHFTFVKVQNELKVFENSKQLALYKRSE